MKIYIMIWKIKVSFK